MKRIPAGFLLEGFQIEGMAKGMNSLTHKLASLLPVTYPPSAVMAGVSTNLGPVVRLDCGEGQTKAQICLLFGRSLRSFRWQSRLHHDSHEVIAGK